MWKRGGWYVCCSEDLTAALEADMKDRGFTLVELMITVAMLAILVVVTLPPVLRAVERREVVQAAQAVLDLIEFAKVQAAARNRAYQVVPVKTDGQPGGNGSVTLNEGTTSACLNFGDPGAIQNVRTVDLARDFRAIHLVALVPSDLDQATLCIKPDGRVLRTDTQLPVPSGDSRYAAGDARIVLQRYGSSGQPEGVQNTVVIPFNGAARLAL